MAGSRYFIDGYNVLLRLKLGEGRSLQERRDELVARVAATGLQAFVAFDSSEAVHGLKSTTPRRIEVAFARPGQSADDLLVEKVRRSKDLRGAVVVSDDREVAQRCGAMGARKLSTAEFGRLLKPAEAKTPGKEHPLSKAEVKDWMNWFGFDQGAKDAGSNGPRRPT
jgi:predicted RNA-binding protein with PIN domain